MKKIIIAAALVFALPAFAQVSGNLGVSASASGNAGGVGVGVQAKGSVTARAELISRAQARADQEITRRIDALNKLSVRVNAMGRVSAEDKASLSASIQGQIDAMNTLKAKVDGDATAQSTSSLKLDIQSITGSYRIYMLIIPKAAINAAADRVLTIVGNMTDLSAKLQARITAAQTAGNDTSAAVTALADLNAKISDANVQAQAAVTETANLSPDEKDQAKLQANLAALKDARAKIAVAQKDFVAARADAQTIIKLFTSWKVKVNASTSIQ